MAVSDLVQFHDTTLRDGVQSLWAMYLRYGALEAVLDELDQGGMINVEPSPCFILSIFKNAVFNLKEDPWEICSIMEKKGKEHEGRRRRHRSRR